jgi:hypothetical protein
VHGYTGWTYCARTPEQDLFLVYFEKDAPQAQIRGARKEARYAGRWFDTRNGQWSAPFELTTDETGYAQLPSQPSTEDWGLKLALAAISHVR